MASFFTRALDRLTPWNRGGEVERRKKREEEQQQRQQQTSNRKSNAPGLSVSVARPNENIVTPIQPKVQRPDDLFKTLNDSLKMPGAPNPLTQVKKTPEIAAEAQPEPGEVIRPTVRVTNSQPTQNLMVNGRNVRDIPDSPEIILNRELDRGKSWEQIAKDNRFDVKKVEEYSRATRPNYGIKIAERPKQSFGNRIRDVFDTNTESDKWRRQEGNRTREAGTDEKPIIQERTGNLLSRTPVIGHVAKMGTTAGVQVPQVALTAQMDLATRELSAASAAIRDAKATKDPARIAAASQRFDNASRRIRDIQKDLDTVENKFKKNSGGLFNVGTLYDEESAKKGDIETAIKDIALPTAVTGLDLYTLGKGSTVSEALKQGGRGALRSQTDDILRMIAGNYLSGDLDARAQGATGWDPVKSGATNAVLGTAPDIGLPLLGRSFNNRILPKIMSGRGVDPADLIEELDEAAISSSAEAANQALRPKPIRVAQNIPIKDIAEDLVEVPVTRRPSGRPLIKEIEGDFGFKPMEELAEIRVNNQAAQANDFNAATSAPDPRVAGVRAGQPESPFNLTPEAVKSNQDQLIDEYADFLRQMGEGNGVNMIPDGEGGYFRASNNYRPGMGSGKISKAQWREEAERQLAAGKADPAIQKAFNDAADPEVQAMLSKGDTTEEAPIGRPIEVKQATGIPVRDETVVPTNMPETPGQVRVTEATAPMAAKSEAVASAPVVATPPVRLPAETQAILDNPKNYTKRQVQAARNARKNARAVAKANEDTSAAMARINENAPQRVAGQAEGFAETGEFARGKRGNAYQKASNQAEKVAGQEEMAVRSVDDLITEIGAKESFSPGDRRRLSAAIENMAKSNPDDLETRMILKKLQAKSRTELGQGLALIPRVIRRNASADTITGRWENKIAKALDDPTKMSAEDLATVQRVNGDFTLARDTAARLEEQFKRSGSESDFKAWEQAYTAARKADENAKLTEVKVAQRVLKGQKGAHSNKVIDDLRKESNVNTMDLVTSNMLSGTATGFRNFFGTELAGVENRLFANTRAKITKGLFGEDVGGYSRKGARLGRKLGLVKFGGDAARRASVGGKNPLEWAKNWSTTINSAGESSIQSQVYSRLGRYYQNKFKADGLSGKELDMRMRHAMLTDPDTMADTYLDATMKSSGLTGLFDKGQTIEKAVTDFIGRQTDNKVAQGASKLLMRMLVGFPTATSNFMYQSTKRLTMGLPSYIETGAKLARGDKLGAAQAFDRAMKETGSGMAVLGLGVALGKADMISGAYPDDPEERARWEREGISENSIKIGGNWFPIPQGAGMLGLPLLTGAAIGREGDSDESVKEMYSPKNLSKLLPTDQLQGALNMFSGNGAPQDFKNFVASSVRAGTPVGALLNQISKSFDDTKNDTTTKSLGANIMDQIYSGIPGVNNAMNIPDKLDDEGNPIKNPSPLALAFGATSTRQGAGEERTAQLSEEAQNAVKGLTDLGLLDDQNMDGVLEGDALEAYKKMQQGRTPSNDDIQKIKEGLVKGVSSEGTDTAYLEREQYDTNLAVLKLKKELMEQDKTVKPSSIKDIDTAIKRGEIYKKQQIPYDMIKAYQDTSLEEWRDMGDPESDNENQDMYQKLWAMDEIMTGAGVSYKKGALDKQKFYAKAAGKGRGGARGGRAASEMSSEFGTLKRGAFTPEVQQYESIDQKSGSVPIIRRVRPNIVHKISSSG